MYIDINFSPALKTQNLDIILEDDNNAKYGIRKSRL